MGYWEVLFVLLGGLLVGLIVLARNEDRGYEADMATWRAGKKRRKAAMREAARRTMGKDEPPTRLYDQMEAEVIKRLDEAEYEAKKL